MNASESIVRMTRSPSVLIIFQKVAVVAAAVVAVVC